MLEDGNPFEKMRQFLLCDDVLISVNAGQKQADVELRSKLAKEKECKK